MDFIQCKTLQFSPPPISRLLTYQTDYLPQIYYYYHTYYTTYHPYLAPIFRVLFLTQSYFYRYLFPTVYPIYALANNALHTLSSDSPDIMTLLILSVVLIISLKALDYMRRTIIYWIGKMIRLSMHAALLAVGGYVWQRGLEQSLEDFGWVWGLIEGFSQEGQRVGTQRARRSEREARRQAQAGMRGRYRARG